MLVAADVTQRADVDAMIAAVAKRFGRLDIVVNNAAVRFEAAFADLTYADWRQAQAVCVDGAFHCTQAALPSLRASGAGTVINIGGMTAYTGASMRAHVVTAKAALAGLTRALAHELAAFGITVNCVSPGWSIRSASKAVHRAILRITPITSRCWDGAAASRKSPAPSCGWQVPARATSRARRCTSTAARTWAVDVGATSSSSALCNRRHP